MTAAIPVTTALRTASATAPASPVATPLYFGHDNQLFGWYYPAAGPIARNCNVVLCRPLGYEYITSYRGFRVLAERLAANGFSVLSFDYFSTGNSAGDANDTDLLRRWTDSVTAAADEIQRRAPGNPLALIGLRFGAALAQLTALERGDVDALVLWEPCVSGKSYMRQVKMLAATAGNLEQPAEQRAAALGIEAAGFMFTNATASTISSVQLTQISPTTTKRALILTRDDVTTDPKLATHLRTVGLDIEERQFPGYVDFMAPTFRSVVPDATIDGIVQWLAALHPGTGQAPTTAATTASATITATSRATTTSAQHSNVSSVSTRSERRPRPDAALSSIADVEIREQIVQFADPKIETPLFGILTSPEQYDPKNPAVILLNTGADHHVGPHRLYVPLSRDWAARGLPVLRFDLAGIGDSPTPTGVQTNRPYGVHALDNINAAVAFLRDRGYHRVILAGICSGAFHAVHAAHKGAGVIGAIAVNPPLYIKDPHSFEIDPFWQTQDTPHWVEEEVTRVKQSMFDPKKWLRFVTGKVGYKDIAMLVLNQGRISARRVTAAVVRRLPGGKKNDPRAEILDLFPPNVHNYLIYSRGDPGFTFMTRLLGEKLKPFAKMPQLSIEVVDGADHTFMATRLQSRLTELLTEALLTRFHTPPTPPSTS